MCGRLTIVAAICLRLSSHATAALLDGFQCDGADAACESSDAIGLLQHGAPYQVKQHPANASSLEQLAGVVGSGISIGSWPWPPNYLAYLAKGFTGQVPAKVDCRATPALCSNLLQCDKKPVTPLEVMWWRNRMTGLSNQANLRLWCMGAGTSPDAAAAAKWAGVCLLGEDTETPTEEQRKQMDTLIDPMASYCFGSGICHMPKWPKTNAEAAQICTQWYPKWNQIGFTDAWSAAQASPKHANIYRAQTACAMGTFMYDTRFCWPICNNGFYRQKYGGSIGTPGTNPV